MKEEHKTLTTIVALMAAVCAVVFFWRLLDGGGDAAATAGVEWTQSPDSIGDEVLDSLVDATFDVTPPTMEPEHRVAAEGIGGKAMRLLVLDLDGEPVPRLRLGLHASLSSVLYDLENVAGYLYVGTTDTAGMLALAPFEEDAVAIVSLDPEWLIVGSSVLSGPWTGSFTLRARRGGGIRGVVVGPEGPVSGATVGCLVSTTWGSLAGEDAGAGLQPGVFDPANLRWAVTDGQGRFVIQGLLPTSSRLDVLAVGHAPLLHRFEGPPVGEVVDLGKLTLSRGVEVLFEVRGMQSAGARLFLEAAADAFTWGNAGLELDERGQVLVSGMQPGKYQWTVVRGEALGTQGSLRVPEAGGTVRIELPPLRGVMVQVTTTAGNPVGAFTVKAKEKGARTQEVRGIGSVPISCSEGSILELTVEAPGFVPSRKLTVPADESVIGVRLARPGALELHLAGLDSLTAVRVGVVPEDRESLLELVDRGIAPVPLRLRSLDHGHVRLAELAPGKAWVILDHGGGPEAFGPYRIEEGSMAVAEISVRALDFIDGLVKDSRTGAPLAGVSVRRCGPAGEGAALAALLAGLAGDEAPDATTDEEGRFRIGTRPGERLVLVFEKPGYAPATHSWSPGAHEGREVAFHLEQMPVTAIQILLTSDSPAPGAVAEFSRQLETVPEPLGEVRVDTAGRATLDRIPAGPCEAIVRFEPEPGTRYRVGFPALRVQEGVPLRLVVAADAGWISLGSEASSEEGEVLLRGRPSNEADWIEVRCGESGPPLPVPPGEYRATRQGALGLEYASLEVRTGETTRVEWMAASGELSIELEGDDWISARVRLTARDGALLGYIRDVELERTEGDQRISELPRGRYRVTLIDWIDARGRSVEAHWSERAVVGDVPTSATFEIGAAIQSRIRVVDRSGEGLGGVPVRCIVDTGDGLGILATTTNRSGVARLVLAPGESVWMASPRELAPTIRQYEAAAGGELELVCDAGGSLEIELAEDPVTRSWIVRLLPDPPPSSSLAAALLGRALDELGGPLSDLGPGGTVSLDRIPAGTYALVGIEENRIVASRSVTIETGRRTRASLGPDSK